MAPDATRNNYIHWVYLRDGTHQDVPQPRRLEPPPRRRQQEPQPQPRLQEPQQRDHRLRDNLVGINPVLDVVVYSATGIRSGYRMVMGMSGSRRRKVAKAGAAVVAGAALVAGATLVGGVLVVTAIF